MIHHNLHKHIPSWLLVIAAVFLSVIFLILASSFLFEQIYQNRVMPGVLIGDIDLGAQTAAETKKIIHETVTRLQNGVSLRFAGHSIIVPPVSLDPDLATIASVSFDEEKTFNQVWEVGRGGNVVANFSEQLNGFLFHHRVEVSLSTDPIGLLNFLQKEFADFDHPAKNASIDFSGEKHVVKEADGQTLDFERAIRDVISRLHDGRTDEVVIIAHISRPMVTAVDVQKVLPQIDDFLNLPETKLTFEKQSWKLGPKIAQQWLGFEKEHGQTKIILDTELIKKYLTDQVASTINQEPENARLAMDNGRVSVWQSGRDGREVDLEKTAAQIARWPDFAKATSDKPEEIQVVTKVISGSLADATAEELGLKEIIGTGVSQFAGSPVNRRHNIRVGANSLNGLLIKPGEEFSLLKALGEIDGKHGYLQELVIKENKTTPEFGGGLCQIGTTMFRATFNSGLPITQRRNHSYRVVYYEPAGTDATIYNPAPDYRFINDTGHYILIQARMEGNNLAFDFWGTKDGRQVQFTKPIVYNIVAPPPLKTVETTDLPEGQKKCTEKAHNGADAYFDYTVTYPNGDVKAKRFSSHYIPWQAVCLVGVKKLPDGGLPESPTETITPSVTPATP